jgi:hypothetical protein
MIAPYSKFSAWPLLAMVLLLNLQCGYRLAGRGRNLPANARTIAIPSFRNETARFQAGHFVTAAVRDEFVSRSGLRLVVALDQADLIMEGRITAFETVPLTAGESGKARTHDLRITVHVRLSDVKKNELVCAADGLVFKTTYGTDAADFFSQEPEVLERIAARFAAAMVTSILDSF